MGSSILYYLNDSGTKSAKRSCKSILVVWDNNLTQGRSLANAIDWLNKMNDNADDWTADHCHVEAFASRMFPAK